MKRITIPIGIATAALASAFQFSNTTANVDATGLHVAWNETTGTNGPRRMAYNVSADATATYGCFNNGGRVPSDKKKVVTFTKNILLGVTETVGTNGTVNGAIRLPIPAVGRKLSCPSGLKAKIGTVSYSNVKIRNATIETSYKFPGAFAKTINSMSK